MKIVKKAKIVEKNLVILEKPVVNIIIDYEEWDKFVPQLDLKVKTAITKTLDKLGMDKEIELSIRLTSDEEMKELNYKYRGKPNPTNVLAFSQDKDSTFLFQYNVKYIGDIAIGYQRVHKESCNQEKTLSAHLIHLIIHGLLHLLGYSHKNELDSKVMEKIEINVLSLLGYKNPFVLI